MVSTSKSCCGCRFSIGKPHLWLVGGGWLAWKMEDLQQKYWSIIPFSVGLFYSCLWVSVYRLYKESINAQSLIMSKLADIALQPLTEKFLK